MSIIKHKLFGMGEEISRETVNGILYVTVRFENGKEQRLVVPDSFKSTYIEVEGPLKDEIDEILAEKRAQLLEQIADKNSKRAAATPTRAPGKRNRTAPAGTTFNDFEDYLVKSGYKCESEVGHQSTVYSYSKAVESVLEEEGITYSELVRNISSIASKYDIGGEKVDFGNKSNRTYINALRRFEEYVETL